MALSAQRRLVIASGLILTTLSACGTSSPVRDFCLIYEPIYHSPADTEETRQQADRNNAAWLELCE